MAGSTASSDFALSQRIEALEAQLQFQAGALADSREQQARQHSEMLQMMRDLNDTISHTRALAAGGGTVREEANEVPPPPGFAREGRELPRRVLSPNRHGDVGEEEEAETLAGGEGLAEEGEDPLQTQDAWAFWKGKGGGGKASSRNTPSSSLWSRNPALLKILLSSCRVSSARARADVGVSPYIHAKMSSR